MNECPKPRLSIRDFHREKMTFNWNKQPIYTLPIPCVTFVEKEGLIK